MSKKVNQVSLLCLGIVLSCSSSGSPKLSKSDSPVLDVNFKKYWNSGDAEISSYVLKQSRYGEIRDGEAVMVFVTEPFSKDSQTKADRPSPNNIPVLKCNFTKKFYTGIYPYSIMTSTFSPIDDPMNGLKASCSVQEWCGHAYSELNRKNKLETINLSYFEGESSEIAIQSAFLEDDFWSAIRISPSTIPTGEHLVLPPLHLIRMLHLPIVAQKCEIENQVSAKVSKLKLYYSELNRTLEITYKTKFPHEIEEWMDSYPDGFSPNARYQISSGKLKKRIKAPYWQLNRNADSQWKDSLQLKF
ncbi:MAG: septum formation inhibitor Maf [Bacteroidetes bacterium]|nr:septum formation inhibitor Maf [Bacteroidota bacterium]